MPRRTRISICGYHHIYNRGVAKNNIFLNDIDKEKFLDILAEISKEFKFNIHSFCLMDNHYHLLLENTKENLSDGMRQLNAKYAKFFNSKYERVGHLWQDRFKSWYILDEKYLFTLFKYIESNPVKAGIVEKVGVYRYSSSYSMFRDAVPFFLRNSFILRDYNPDELLKALNFPLTDVELRNLDKLKKVKYIQSKNDELQERATLSEYFKDIVNKNERNIAILKAFNDDFKKSEIARELKLSAAGVCRIIKKYST